MTAHGRNVVAQPSTHCAPSEPDKWKLQCSAANPWKASMASHSTDWPPQRAWLRVPEVRWGDLRPPVFPASLETLRASKLAKLPQVHERLPPTRAAA